MNKIELLDKIDLFTSQLESLIKIKNKKGHFDLNKIAEDVVCKILNIVYDLKLVNLNHVESEGFPAIDLGDKHKKVAYQITSSKKSEKIVDTLKKAKKHKLNEKYNDINIVILGEKQKKYDSDKLKKISENMEFSVNDNIIDVHDLMRKINTINEKNKLEKILEVYNDYFGNNSRQNVKERKKFKINNLYIDKIIDKNKNKVNKEELKKIALKVEKLINSLNKIDKRIICNIIENYTKDKEIDLEDIFNIFSNLEEESFQKSILRLIDKDFLKDEQIYDSIEKTNMDIYDYYKQENICKRGIIKLGCYGQGLRIFGKVMNLREEMRLND